MYTQTDVNSLCSYVRLHLFLSADFIYFFLLWCILQILFLFLFPPPALLLKKISRNPINQKVLALTLSHRTFNSEHYDVSFVKIEPLLITI